MYYYAADRGLHCHMHRNVTYDSCGTTDALSFDLASFPFTVKDQRYDFIPTKKQACS
jgi:hypothetical protein